MAQSSMYFVFRFALRRSVSLSFGYMFQWATDQDIANAIADIGVTDFQDVKFFENRANGQSKGFCVISLGSDQSIRMVMERLPKKDIHGQHPVVTLPTKQVMNKNNLIRLYFKDNETLTTFDSAVGNKV